MIELPAGFADGVATSATAQIAQFSPLLTLIMGLLLAVIAVGFLIAFLKNH